MIVGEVMNRFGDRRDIYFLVWFLACGVLFLLQRVFFDRNATPVAIIVAGCLGVVLMTLYFRGKHE